MIHVWVRGDDISLVDTAKTRECWEPWSDNRTALQIVKEYALFYRKGWQKFPTVEGVIKSLKVTMEQNGDRAASDAVSWVPAKRNYQSNEAFWD